MNSCNFVGRVGRDAATRPTQTGKTATGWSLAVDTGWGQNKQTIWLDCTLWGDRGEKLAQYITKGAQLGVSGELGTREYEGKTYVTLNVRDVSLIGGRQDSQQSAPAPRQQSAPAGGGGGGFDMDSDVPFDRLARGIGGHSI